MYHPHRKKLVTALAVTPIDVFRGIVKGAVVDLEPSSMKSIVLGALRARDYGRLLAWAESVVVTEYDDPLQYYRETQVASLIRKYPFTTREIPGINPELKAVSKFEAAELRCKRVNRKRVLMRAGARIDVRMQYWDHARNYIRKVLGETPDLSSIYDKCDLTGGASLGVHGNATNIWRKVFAERWTVTPMALKYVLPALWNNIQIRDCILPGAVKCYDYEAFKAHVMQRAHIVDYNKVAFVPKTARTHRSIAVEPLLNGFVQKGVDEEMRELLKKRASINLRDQTKNQRLAYAGSLGGHNPYCTVDLSAASDSMSIEVVRDLLPPDWFRLLLELRSPSYMTDDGVKTRYHKFCSMGNGFCFPLESLLFAALAFAACKVSNNNPYDFNIYGDDIVIRQGSALLLIELLQEMGFKTNVEKTFIFGPFRESCGADWYAGRDVRPVFLSSNLADLRQVFAFHNSFYKNPFTESFSEGLRTWLRSKFGSSYLRPGREPGDGAYSVPLDAAMKSRHVTWHREYQRWVWKEIASMPARDNVLPKGALRDDEIVRQTNLTKWYAIIRGAKPDMAFPLRYVTKAKVRQVCYQYNDSYHHDGLYALLRNGSKPNPV